MKIDLFEVVVVEGGARGVCFWGQLLLCGVFVIGSSSPDKVVGEVRVHMFGQKSLGSELGRATFTIREYMKIMLR